MCFTVIHDGVYQGSTYRRTHDEHLAAVLGLYDVISFDLFIYDEAEAREDAAA